MCALNAINLVSIEFSDIFGRCSKLLVLWQQLKWPINWFPTIYIAMIAILSANIIILFQFQTMYQMTELISVKWIGYIINRACFYIFTQSKLNSLFLSWDKKIACNWVFDWCINKLILIVIRSDSSAKFSKYQHLILMCRFQWVSIFFPFICSNIASANVPQYFSQCKLFATFRLY